MTTARRYSMNGMSALPPAPPEALERTKQFWEAQDKETKGNETTGVPWWMYAVVVAAAALLATRK